MRISGTLVHDESSNKPIHNFRLVFRGSNSAGQTAEYGTTHTDMGGAFSFDAGDASPTVVVGLERERSYDATGFPVDSFVDAFTIPIPAGLTDLGILRVKFWLYDSTRSVARAGRNAAGETDQKHAPGYTTILNAAIAKIGPIAAGLGARLTGGEALSLETIQAAFPEPLTVRMDRFAKHSASDAWLGEMVLNGFNTAPLLREVKGEGRLAVAFKWGETACDGVHDLSDAVALFEERGGKLLPVEIRIALREPGAGAQWKPTTTKCVRLGEPEWEAAKHVFRCAYLLSGVLEGHIIKTHFFVEQYCIAAYRNLRLNPIRELLLPHLQEVVATDMDAELFAFGPSGQIPNGSALGFPYIEARARALLGQMDWNTFVPRSPATEEHKYALLLGQVWELLGAYVADFVETNRAQITEHWAEIQRFSEELVAHSPPRSVPSPPEGFSWQSANEIIGAGGTQAITPICDSSAATPPTAQDLARLIRCCQHLLCHATFIHTWVHDGQYDVGGDLRLASLALRNGSFGPLAQVGPTATEAIGALTTNSNGILANFGFVLANETGDVPPQLRQRFLGAASQMADLRFDITRIRSRINI